MKMLMKEMQRHLKDRILHVPEYIISKHLCKVSIFII